MIQPARKRVVLMVIGILVLPVWSRLLNDAEAAKYSLILCGSGGTEEYKQKFAAWGERLRDVLIERLNHPREHVHLLTESPSVPDAPIWVSNKENIQRQLVALSGIVSASDELFVFLIGHGSYLREESRFQIPGKDITAKEFKEYLDPIPAGRIVLINSTSSSAGFINVLSGPGRILCTATKSVDERNATEFMEGFLKGLEEGSADQDRDERISVLEACQQGAALTEAWYKEQDLIATEHALLDDNGDGLGTRLPLTLSDETVSTAVQESSSASRDGKVAARCFLQDYVFPPYVPPDLVERYVTLMNQIEELKSRKASLETDDYYSRLEILLIRAAEANRAIRSCTLPAPEE
ncbi:MAG TPA: hypothetical protein PK878_06130 [bacterium]|nr:hypothetical protein [Candidatus Omnitrophota bacterium]HOJ59845.1 hypothetical protein [bacterium]HOL95381.1 hypothetical protein [bacterium]HPO99879.1 hypothetical protein [bacterium]HXK92724.1 hypothetical protein [bacterium]